MKQTSIERWLLPHGAVTPCGNLSHLVLSGKVLLLGTCSKTKRPVQQGTPVQLYGSWQVELLDRVCRKNGLRYGVLSDEYGVVMDRETVVNYDTPPDAVTEDGFKRLGEVLATKMEVAGFSRLCLFTVNPKRTVPYCKIILGSGLPFTWVPSVEWLRELGGSALF